MSDKVDRFGAVASSLCAVHCAVAALLPVAFGALGLSFLVGHEAEWVFTLVAVGFAVAALVVSWRKHSSIRVAALLSLGIIGLLASRGIEMSSGHHDQHESSHHVAENHEKKAGHEDDKKGSHDEHEAEHGHEGIGHIVGTIVGVLGGLVLVAGHISNIQLWRRRPEESSD